MFDRNLYHTWYMAKGYRQVSLPEPLYEQMLEYLKSHPEYTSVADLVKELVRRELRSEK
jgi:Arc/MetJ-type ribon-helix-helix transcriptional regulator